MKKILFVLLFVIVQLNVYSQKKCPTECISSRIDSICKLKNVSDCEVYFYYLDRDTYKNNEIYSRSQDKGKFLLVDGFLVVNDVYYDLSKLVNFYIRVDKNGITKLNIFLQVL